MGLCSGRDGERQPKSQSGAKGNLFLGIFRSWSPLTFRLRGTGFVLRIRIKKEILVSNVSIPYKVRDQFRGVTCAADFAHVLRV